MIRSPYLLLAAALAVTACTPAEQTPAAQDISALTGRPLPEALAYPEGIAFDPDAGVYYVASAADGAVVRVTLADNAATLLVPGGRLAPGGAPEFPVTLGVRLDDADRLWVTGGARGDVHVIDTRTGQRITHLAKPDGPPSLLNDLTFAGNAAYITDSTRPVLWRISRDADRIGSLEPWLDLEAAIPHAEGPNLNGIVSSADGATLVAVQMNTGRLWRIDVATRAVTPIDLGGALLKGGDGLVLDGRRLYATVQDSQEIVAIDLSADLTSGSIVGRLRDERLVAPATAFINDGRLFVVVTQMNLFADDAATRPFNVFELPLSAITPVGG